MIEDILRAAVAAGVFPGAVARVEALDGRGPLLELAVGRVSTHPEGPEVRVDTAFDLASITKLYTATAALRLAVDGIVDLNMDVGEKLGIKTLYGVTPIMLLEHKSGLPAWRPYYESSSSGEPGDVLAGALGEVLDRDPGEAAVYSDVGFLVLMAVLEEVSGQDLETLVRSEVLIPLGLSATGYRGTGAGDLAALELLETGCIAATERCPRRGLLVGEVHDDNAWAMGGVAPHAGLYATADEVATFARGWWDAPDIGFLPRELRDAAWSSPTQGFTHSLGWDTVSGDKSTAGRLLSRNSHGHLGFTGTSLWIDPERAIAVILLSNRVHPSRQGPEAMANLRRLFHEAVAEFVDALP